MLLLFSLIIIFYEFSDNPMDQYNGQPFYANIEHCINMIYTMVSFQHSHRPSCPDILDRYVEWAIDGTVVTANATEFESTLNALKANDNQFFYEFLRHKLNITE